jgi:alcohol dehydrogenase
MSGSSARPVSVRLKGASEKLGSAMQGFKVGQRVIAGAITPSGTTNASLCDFNSQCSGALGHGWAAVWGLAFWQYDRRGLG